VKVRDGNLRKEQKGFKFLQIEKKEDGPQLYIASVGNTSSNSDSSSNTPSEEEMFYDVPFPIKRYVPQEKRKEVTYVTYLYLLTSKAKRKVTLGETKSIILFLKHTME
jgi:hypothetical protein